MNNLVTTPLPASWVSTRLGVDSAELDRLRERGELLAGRADTVVGAIRASAARATSEGQSPGHV